MDLLLGYCQLKLSLRESFTKLPELDLQSLVLFLCLIADCKIVIVGFADLKVLHDKKVQKR